MEREFSMPIFGDRTRRGTTHWLASAASALCALLAGCHSTSKCSTCGPAEVVVPHGESHYHGGSQYGGSQYGVQPACNQGPCGPNGQGVGYASHVGNVPRELDKVTLPTYVIEPPDMLLIEAVNNIRRPDAPIRPGDPVMVRVARTIPIDENDDPVTASFKQIDAVYVVHSDGALDLGPEYGRVRVAGYDVATARGVVERHLAGTLTDPLVSLQLAEPRTRQHVAGEHLVRPDGTVALGIYGSVHVTGLTIDQARYRIERHLAQYMVDPTVSLDVLWYNSKVYYVITDGAGAGEQVYRFPCTGNETVLDAIAQISGLPVVSCKKDIWVARPRPAGAGADQVLDVDWDAIARGADTTTNYQVLPGDRIYVRADDLVTFDTWVAKVVSPFERILGFVLLGNGTFRNVQYGHRQNGNGGGVGGF